MFDKDGMGALVNSSRGIIGAWKKSGKYSESMSADDALDLVAESAREAAKDMRDNLRADCRKLPEQSNETQERES